MEYQEFLKKKSVRIQEKGFVVNENDLNPNLFDFQKHIVKTALQKGQYAIFAECGLGKTIMQLVWAEQVVKYTNKPVLILTPLAVGLQTLQESKKFNIIAERFNNKYDNKVYLLNYEQLNNVDCSKFSGVVLDESSILKSLDGKIKTRLIKDFAETPYKLCCTATPAPNDPTEIGNHSEFLGVLKQTSMLSKYFVHDSGQTSVWRLKGHAEKEFYKWVGSWSVFVKDPADMGFCQVSFKLPKLELKEYKIEMPNLLEDNLFNDSVVNAINHNRELRKSMELRLNKVLELVNDTTEESFIIWVRLNEEADMLKKLLPNAVEVRGNEKTEIKESKLLGFANGDFKILITKSKIAQYGMNFQNCNNQIFASIDFSFESLYQSIRRSYRFGQKNKVNIHIITTDTMQNVLSAIDKKQINFDTMRESITMSNLTKNSINEYNPEVFESKYAKLIHGDCVEEVKSIPDKSIHFSIFSPPFAELYVYSNSPRDMGNVSNYKEFEDSFKYLTTELNRIMLDGRIVAIHCADLPIQKGKEGYIGLRDFSGLIIKSMQDSGFIYHSRVTIWKDPVVEMQRTKALGLLHKQLKKDAVMSRVGNPDYILLFRAAGENAIPIKQDMSVDKWQKIASPVWLDINQTDTLNKLSARDDKDEKHICPLQLGVIERLILLYTNKGETVFTPFMGIGSEIHEAIRLGRNGIGIELKDSYFKQTISNIERATYERDMPKLISHIAI